MSDSSGGPGRLQSFSTPPSSTIYSNGTNGSPLVSRTKYDDAVEAFIGNLGGPTHQLLQLFHEMEIDNAEHLNWLCLQPEDFWDDVKDYMLRKGISLFHWLLVKKGLRERKAGLGELTKLIS